MFKLLTRPIGATQVVALALATFINAWSLPSLAAQATGQFVVSVKFIPAVVQTPPVTPSVPVITQPPGLPVSAFCTKNNIPSAHGAIVTVVCSTGAVVDVDSGHPYSPMLGGSYRYVTHVALNGTLADTVDAFGGAGTTTAWRLVKSSYRDYLEMTLGW